MAEEAQEYVDSEATEEAKPIAEETAQAETEQTAAADDLDEIPEDLPEDPAKQREAFIKMRQSLAEAKRQLKTQPAATETVMDAEEDEGADALFGAVRQPPLPTSQRDPRLPDDDYTKSILGETDRATATAHNAAQRAAATEQRMEEMEARLAHPDIDSNPNFRRRIQEKYVFERLRATSNGKPVPSVKQVADKVAKEMGLVRATAEKAVSHQQQQRQTELEHAAFEATGSSTNVGDASPDNSGRRRKINQGDMRALEESLLEEELSGFTERDLGFY